VITGISEVAAAVATLVACGFGVPVAFAAVSALAVLAAVSACCNLTASSFSCRSLYAILNLRLCSRERGSHVRIERI